MSLTPLSSIQSLTIPAPFLMMTVVTSAWLLNATTRLVPSQRGPEVRSEVETARRTEHIASALAPCA